ncbi:MAG: isoprenyl transferase [Acidobacteria bacterium]|nr:isoprenyl transferase [Acidobacteriota bacterium]
MLARIDPQRIPRHVAVIMDGNGRWAAARSLPRIEGHRAGADSVKEITETSVRLGVHYLTLYAFSVENWKRPITEVNELMRLLRRYVREDLPTLMKHKIRLKALGRLHELDYKTRTLVEKAIHHSRDNTGLQLNIALNYGGRTELVDAMRALGRLCTDGGLKPEDIDESTIGRHLYTAGIPEPDLLIRTSGEYRISNFLLWQTAYTEFYFTPVLWPDFRKIHYFEAIIDFQQRERRYGGVKNV